MPMQQRAGLIVRPLFEAFAVPATDKCGKVPLRQLQHSFELVVRDRPDRRRRKMVRFL
jgi:hypothetical protein